MSRYKDQPLDFSRLKTIPLADRGGKVTVGGFAAAYTAGSGIAGLIDSLPHLLAADHFRAVIAALAEARAKKRASATSACSTSTARRKQSNSARAPRSARSILSTRRSRRWRRS